MSHKIFASIALLLFWLTSCASPAPTPTPAPPTATSAPTVTRLPTATAVPPTAASTLVPTATPVPLTPTPACNPRPASSASGPVRLPTALAGKNNTIFPVPSNVRDYLDCYIDYGDGAIDFVTSLSVKEIVSYYRNILARNALTEEEDKASVTDSTFSLIFDYPTGEKYLIEGAPLGNGLIKVKVREK